MVEYSKYILDNGLTLLVHEAWDTPLATVNVLYNVGARDESPQRTGFAHLFEHLMFGGTPRVPDFDAVVSGLGGESNAFTNNDYTNYYMTLPVEGLAIALELEADRMMGLAIDAKGLAVQQRVVTEEYNQRYMNQPYGDVWLQLRPLCYKVHPYRWSTIGADIRHVSEATLDDVREFHQRFYRPDNAIVAVAAPMKGEEVLRLVAQSWGTGNGERRTENATFGQSTLTEPVQTESRELRVVRHVPASMLYVAWPMCDHFDPKFYACDLISDVLGNGESSRLYRRLVQEQGLFTEADACITGDAGPGLIVLSGKLADGVDMDTAAAALRGEAYALATEGVGEFELQKVINKFENTFVFSHYKASDRAMALCYYTWLGDTDLINNEPERYHRVTPAALHATAAEMLVPQRENILYYEAER